MMSRPIAPVDRRRFVAMAAGALSGASSQAAGTAPQSGGAARVPADVGRKFNADGTVHPFAGNTFVGHLGQQGPDFMFFDTLLDVYREVPRYAFSRKLALLPPSSYHVTLIVGVNDVDRYTPGWPASLDPKMPMQAINAQFLDRLSKTILPQPEPFDFVMDLASPPGTRTEGTLGFPLRPANLATAARLKASRDRLATLLDLRRADHDHYRFHVSLGYLFEFLTEDESAELAAATLRWMKRLDALGRPLRIPAFHFCALRDMYAFRTLQLV